jgi:hypothetical protein
MVWAKEHLNQTLWLIEVKIPWGSVYSDEDGGETRSMEIIEKAARNKYKKMKKD